MKNKNYLLLTILTILYNFWILFKLIIGLIVLVYAKLWYASFPCKITFVLNF